MRNVVHNFTIHPLYVNYRRWIYALARVYVYMYVHTCVSVNHGKYLVTAGAHRGVSTSHSTSVRC